jgi:hypothetical protein
MPATVAAVVAGADAAAEADADGQGAAAAEADAGALALGAAALALGAAALAAAAGALALAAAVAQSPRADWAIVVVLPPETAMMIPRVRPSAIGMARGTAIRAARLFLRRRCAAPCPLSIQSTSMGKSPVTLPVHHGRPARFGTIGKF